MDLTIKKQEQDHLKGILEKLKDAKKILLGTMSVIGSDTLDKLKELRESSSSSDFNMYIEQLHEKNEAFNFKDKYKRLEEVDNLTKEPYFSRLDLFDQKDQIERKIYIGKFGYTEKMPVITDWRAKIASVYYRYRYPQKNVFYDAPGGREVMDLLLKRTYEIDQGELIKYYDNDIQLDENEIIVDKLEQRTGGVLEDIVETIQVSQMDIIEADPRQVTIVQGCVGSGKSTVAIHKLSHIFFNFPDFIHPERALLVAKSPVLVGYLSTLFPKLGIFDIAYKTLRDLVINIVFREELKIKIDLDKEQDTSKFTIPYKENVDKDIEYLHAEYEERLTELFSEKEFAPFSSLKYSNSSTISENIEEIKKDIQEEYGFQSQQLKEDPSSPKSWFYKENIKTLRKILGRLTTMKNNLLNKDFDNIIKNLGINTNNILGYFDVLMYLYAYSALVGFTKYKKYEYCVVDEGQDFSILEYSILSKFVIRGRFAIFGDLNQSIFNEGVTSWEHISEVVEDAKHAQVYQLDTNYRSTRQIIDLANKILSPYTSDYLPKSINRQGREPIIETENILESFEKHLKADTENLDKSIGVICFDTDLVEKSEQIIKKYVDKEHFVKLDTSHSINYIPQGVYLTKFSDCKGLEFAKVYILGLNLSKVENFMQAKQAFVAVTRAMNEVVILGTE